MKQLRLRHAYVFPFLGALAAVACSAPADEEDSAEGTGSTEEAVAACALPVVPARSLFVTDAAALSHFTLQKVLNQIVATGSTTKQTALGVYQQTLDTLNTKALGHTNGPHCDDHPSGGADDINGFPVQCPRQEGILATTDPFTASSPDSYVPVGIVNRFDLAPADGANCGQHRVVFAKLSGRSSPTNRMFLIFEAVLPNPTPAKGIAACLPVAQFWDNLSSNADATDRGNKINSFYFTGLSGFEPVVKAQHYGIGGGTNTGQIRANMFMASRGGQQWELREFRLAQSCVGTACTLTGTNTPVQTNPFGGLFAGNTTQDVSFQNSFLNQVSPLAARSVAGVGMTTPTADNAGQSDEQDSSTDYAFQANGNTAFLAKVTAKLASLKRTDLTARDIIERATTQSCAGCHELSNNRSIGDGLSWPNSNGFTQIDESSRLSPALTTAFLPARSTVLTNFINAQLKCGGSPDGGVDSGHDSGVDSGRDAGHDSGITDGGGIESDAKAPPPPPPPPVQPPHPPILPGPVQPLPVQPIHPQPLNDDPTDEVEVPLTLGGSPVGSAN